MGYLAGNPAAFGLTPSYSRYTLVLPLAIEAAQFLNHRGVRLLNSGRLLGIIRVAPTSPELDVHLPRRLSYVHWAAMRRCLAGWVANSSRRLPNSASVCTNSRNGIPAREGRLFRLEC
jgi:hypothetical protein